MCENIVEKETKELLLKTNTTTKKTPTNSTTTKLTTNNDNLINKCNNNNAGEDEKLSLFDQLKYSASHNITTNNNYKKLDNHSKHSNNNINNINKNNKWQIATNNKPTINEEEMHILTHICKGLSQQEQQPNYNNINKHKIQQKSGIDDDNEDEDDDNNSDVDVDDEEEEDKTTENEYIIEEDATKKADNNKNNYRNIKKSTSGRKHLKKEEKTSIEESLRVVPNPIEECNDLSSSSSTSSAASSISATTAPLQIALDTTNSSSHSFTNNNNNNSNDEQQNINFNSNKLSSLMENKVKFDFCNNQQIGTTLLKTTTVADTTDVKRDAINDINEKNQQYQEKQNFPIPALIMPTNTSPSLGIVHGTKRVQQTTKSNTTPCPILTTNTTPTQIIQSIEKPTTKHLDATNIKTIKTIKNPNNNKNNTKNHTAFRSQILTAHLQQNNNNINNNAHPQSQRQQQNKLNTNNNNNNKKIQKTLLNGGNNDNNKRKRCNDRYDSSESSDRYVKTKITTKQSNIFKGFKENKQ